jgi:hypothetical protein
MMPGDNVMKHATSCSAAIVLCAMAGLAADAALAQPRQQVVKPPVAQAWIDVATASGMGMPAMGSPMSMMGGMFGGGSGAGNSEFGRTHGMMSGRWVDVTLSTRNNPSLTEAIQTVPEATRLAPKLQLVAPESAPPAPARDGEEYVEPKFERPKGKIYLYWGCSETVRPGQPTVIDLANMATADMGKAFQSRSATQRGTHSAAGRPIWPSKLDRRMVPDGASLVGAHGFSGDGVPEGFRFNIGAGQDLMPAIELNQTPGPSAVLLEWKVIPQARAYFIAAMGARPQGDGADMVFWSSSDVPDMGFGLLEYQTNAAVDRWLGEKVLLAPATTKCAVPKEILGNAGMLRMIAYGTEMNVAYPPRPADPAIAWEPQWAAKVRVKSTFQGMLGMNMADMSGGRARSPSQAQAEQQPPNPQQPEKAPSPMDELQKANPINVLRGLFGK